MPGRGLWGQSTLPRLSRGAAVDFALAGALATLVLAFHGPLLRVGLTLGDDGYLAYGVQRILDGQVLYRDFDRTYAPGIYYLYAPVFRFFGSELTHTRVGALLMLATLAAGSYLLCRPFAPRWAALVAGAFPAFLPPPWHKAFVPLAILAGLAICRHVASGPARSPRLLWAGVGIGCVALFRQEVGAFSLLIAAATLAIREGVAAPGLRPDGPAASPASRRAVEAWARLGAGVAVVWVPVLGGFAWSGALATALEQIVLGGYRTNLGLSLPFPGLFGGWTAEPGLSSGWAGLLTTLFYLTAAAALCGLMAACRALRRHRFGLAHAVLAQWSVMAVLMHTLLLQRSDLAHLKQVLVVPALILAYGLGALARPLGARASSGVSRVGPWSRATALLVLGVWTLTAFQWGWRTDIARRYRVLTHGEDLDEPRARVRLRPGPRRLTSELVSELRSLAGPGEPVFVGPYASLLYFLAERPNPTRHDLVSPGYSARDAVQADIIRRLEDAGVRVLALWRLPWDGRPERLFPDYAPALARHVEEEFRPYRQIGGWVVYTRRDREPGSSPGPVQGADALPETSPSPSVDPEREP